MEYLYTVSEAAQLLKVNKNSIYELINKKYLRILKYGVIKIPAKEIENFVNKYTGYDLSDLNNPQKINEEVNNESINSH